MAQTAEGTVLGTVHYMSPEQALGKKVDTRSDVFSLGVVLYEMVAGRRPFPGDSALGVINAISRQAPEALARFNNEISPEREQPVPNSARSVGGFEQLATRRCFELQRGVGVRQHWLATK